MGITEDDQLPDWAPLALAHARGPLRGALAALLRLDGKLSRIVLGASEPTLAQIRLAWWREEIRREREADLPPPSDPLLADIIESWNSSKGTVAAFIDGWEELLGPQPWDEKIRRSFEHGHREAFASLAVLGGAPASSGDAEDHASLWARAKLALASSDTVPQNPGNLRPLPRELRAVAVIGGLSRRAIVRGGKPLFGDRFSPLAALRLGILGT